MTRKRKRYHWTSQEKFNKVKKIFFVLGRQQHFNVYDATVLVMRNVTVLLVEDTLDEYFFNVVAVQKVIDLNIYLFRSYLLIDFSILLSGDYWVVKP